MTTENLMIGVNGHLKGDLTSHHVEVWGKLDQIQINFTTEEPLQESITIFLNLEYENLQVKLGGQITGDVNVSKKASAKKPINTPKDDVDGYDNDPKPGD